MLLNTYTRFRWSGCYENSLDSNLTRIVKKGKLHLQKLPPFGLTAQAWACATNLIIAQRNFETDQRCCNDGHQTLRFKNCPSYITDDQRPPIFDDEAHGSYDTRQPRPNFSVESFRQMLFPLQENISRYGSHQFGGAQGPLPVIYGPARFVPPHRPAPAVRTPPRFDGPRGNNGQRDFRPSPWENAIQRNVHWKRSLIEDFVFPWNVFA